MVKISDPMGWAGIAKANLSGFRRIRHVVQGYYAGDGVCDPSISSERGVVVSLGSLMMGAACGWSQAPVRAPHLPPGWFRNRVATGRVVLDVYWRPAVITSASARAAPHRMLSCGGVAPDSIQSQITAGSRPQRVVGYR